MTASVRFKNLKYEIKNIQMLDLLVRLRFPFPWEMHNNMRRAMIMGYKFETIGIVKTKSGQNVYKIYLIYNGQRSKKLIY